MIPMEEGLHRPPVTTSGALDYRVRSPTLAAHVCVPAVRVIAVSPIPFPTHFTRRLNCGAGLSRNKGLYRLLHALQLTFYTGFRKIPMVAVLHLMGECQTQLIPRWIPGCRRETLGVNGGVDNQTLSVPP